MAIAACITVYHPDADRLKRVVEALRGSVDAIVLFDNGGGADFLASCGETQRKGLQIIGSGENVGLSKALNRCCAQAVEMGMDRVLLMDQDSIPGPRMVQGLVRGFDGGEDVAIVSPRIVKEERGLSAADRKIDLEEEDIPRAITSGSLLSLDAWHAVGGFDEDLFVDWVDFDFSATLRDAGYRVVRENGVFLEHQLGHATPAKLLIPVVGKGGIHFLRMLRTNHSKARREDKARSWAICLAKKRTRVVRSEETRYVVATVLRDLLVEGDRRGLIKAYVRGYRDGLALLKSKGGRSC